MTDQGKLLAESLVNGRMIATFRLHKPLEFLGRQIALVELPAPKNPNTHTKGLEHLEIVCDRPFSDLASKLSHCPINWSGAKKTYNPELEIDFGDSAIKFHHQSLASVINLESSDRVYSTLKKSEILTKLQAFDPFVAGTFPLALETDESDVDILVGTSQLQEVLNCIDLNYGHESNFTVRDLNQDFEQRLKPSNYAGFTASFELLGTKFEVYASSQPLFEQSGFRHFRIEERILALAPTAIKDEISRLRKSGYKTEAAFARALGLAGDPFLELLNLYNLTELELGKIWNGQ